VKRGRGRYTVVEHGVGNLVGCTAHGGVERRLGIRLRRPLKVVPASTAAASLVSQAPTVPLNATK
jgi:hypothetical protein